MTLEPGKAYRAKTGAGTLITFVVFDAKAGWANVELDESGVVEPNVWLNTGQLLWISSEKRHTEAIARATDEVIEALEESVKAV
jgi:hypothetical protein